MSSCKLRPISERPRAQRGFTALELMVVVLIMSIIAVLGMDSIANFEANQRADRAARETLAYFRYARQLAMSSGKRTQLQFTTTTVKVYSETSTNVFTQVTAPLGMTGNMTLDLGSARELIGTKMNSSASTYTYNTLGSLDTAGTIVFNFGSHGKTLNVTKVGDPQLQ